MDDKTVNRAKALCQLGTQAPRPNKPAPKRKVQTDTAGTILLVEDEPTSIELTSMALQSANFEVLVAVNVSEAIDHLQRHSNICLVLSDIRLPRQDGFTLLEFIKSNLRFQDIPVIMCTSCAQKEVVQHALELGAVDYLAKPFTADMLLQKIQSILACRVISILLVSSERPLLNLLRLALDRRHCITRIAESGKEALEKVESGRPDIVICDIALADCTGPDLLAQIKEFDIEIPVFFLDDSVDSIPEENAVSAGAHGLIKRPWNGDDVYRKVIMSARRSKRVRHQNQ